MKCTKAFFASLEHRSTIKVRVAIDLGVDNVGRFVYVSGDLAAPGCYPLLDLLLVRPLDVVLDEDTRPVVLAQVDQRLLHSDAHLEVGVLPARAPQVESAPALIGLVLVHCQQDVAEATSITLGREVIEKSNGKSY